LFSGLTLTTLLTALLVIQGRAFRSGYLHALGLDESHFPVSTTDALWLAFNGWLSGAVQIAGASWNIFRSQLLSTGLWIFSGVFLLTCLLLFAAPRAQGMRDWFKRRLDVSVANDAVRTSRAGELVTITVGSMMVTVCGIALVPLALFLGAFVLMFSFIVLVYPFLSLGAQAADDICGKPRATASAVMLLNQPTPAYLLECSTQFCALLDDTGGRFVVPVDQVARIEIRNTATAVPSGAVRCSLRRAQNKLHR